MKIKDTPESREFARRVYAFLTLAWVDPREPLVIYRPMGRYTLWDEGARLLRESGGFPAYTWPA